MGRVGPGRLLEPGRRSRVRSGFGSNTALLAPLAVSGGGPSVPSSAPSPAARGWGTRSPSGGADAQKLRGGTWPGLLALGSAEQRPQQAPGGRAEALGAAAWPESPPGQRPRRRGDTPWPQEPRAPTPRAPGALSRASPAPLGKPRTEGALSVAGPELHRHRGARPRGGGRRKGAESAGPAVTRGAAAPPICGR